MKLSIKESTYKEDLKGKEDLGYGFDYKGDPIDRQTVSKLFKIACDELRQYTKLGAISTNCGIDEESFEYYNNGGIGSYDDLIHLKYEIIYECEDLSDYINIYKYQKKHDKISLDFDDCFNTIPIKIRISVDDDNIIVTIEDISVSVYDRPDLSDYYTNNISTMFDLEALKEYILKLSKRAVSDIKFELSKYSRW